MPLEKQCASLELSKELKELGYPQESLFYWIFVTDGNEFGYSLEMHNTADEIYSAPTVAELREILKEKYPMCVSGEAIVSGKWKIDSFEADTEADCRAKTLIYLLKNKFIELK